jgi:predicted nucleic acid-binding protein
MPESRFLLDTNAVIYLTTKGNAISEELQNELNEADLFISVITEIELFAKPSMPPEEEKNLRDFLSQRIPSIDLNSVVKNETIAIRRNSKLKLPDCIVAATAVIMDAVLLTADAPLLNLSWPGLRTQNVLQ